MCTHQLWYYTVTGWVFNQEVYTILFTEVSINPDTIKIMNIAEHKITAVYTDVTPPYTSLVWTVSPATTEAFCKCGPLEQGVFISKPLFLASS